MDSWRGWAALLAAGLPGRPCTTWRPAARAAATWNASQLPRALELRPLLAAVIIGVNDTLRHDFNPDRVAYALAHTVGALRATGAAVLTMRLPDAGRMFGLPGALARPLARRMAAVNAAVDELAVRFDTVHFDAVAHPAAYDRRMWSVDRLHPSERGHRFIAGRFYDRLRRAGLPGAAAPRHRADPAGPDPAGAAGLAGHEGYPLAAGPLHRPAPGPAAAGRPRGGGPTGQRQPAGRTTAARLRRSGADDRLRLRRTRAALASWPPAAYQNRAGSGKPAAHVAPSPCRLRPGLAGRRARGCRWAGSGGG